jgi:hypothetical protein
LQNKVVHSYKIQAKDNIGQLSNFSKVITATPLDTVIPVAPEGLMIVKVTHESIMLTWDVNPEDDVKGYNIYRSVDPDEDDWGEPVNGYRLVEDQTFEDEELNELTIYHYTITAVDEVPNESEFSIVVTGTTLLGPRGPEKNNSISEITLQEDTMDLTSINLYTVFKDPNGDELTFECDRSDHIEVTLFQENGTVMLIPEKDWNGQEILKFYAEDHTGIDLTEITVTVTPVNDAPGPVEIITPKEEIEIELGEILNLEATCFDADLMYGDELEFKWTSNISGEIGIGSILENITLPAGCNLIKVEVFDIEGERTHTTIQIIVTDEVKELENYDVKTDDVTLTNGESEVFETFNITDDEIEPDNTFEDASNLTEEGLKDDDERFNYLILLEVIGVIVTIVIILLAIFRRKSKQNYNNKK